MRSWLLLVLKDDERLYRGHYGYSDDVTSVYSYDSFVPNHKQLKAGDTVVVRGKEEVFGLAVIERIEATDGFKPRLRCPQCNLTKLKERSTKKPRYRCECGNETDTPIESSEPCTLYGAFFGDSFFEFRDQPGIRELWGCAPRLNKQLAIIELESESLQEVLLTVVSEDHWSDELPAGFPKKHKEGSRITVSVNRYERSPLARRECLEHYGYRCRACGFDFAEVYGDVGRNVIDVHHLSLLSELGEDYELDPIRDLRPVCPNCHRIIHRSTPPLEIDEVRRLVSAKALDWD